MEIKKIVFEYYLHIHGFVPKNALEYLSLLLFTGDYNMIIYNRIGLEIFIFEDSLIDIWYCFDKSTVEIKILPFEKFKYEKLANSILITNWIFSFYKRKILNDNSLTISIHSIPGTTL